MGRIIRLVSKSKFFRFKIKIHTYVSRLKAYLRKLLIPIYLFPFKLITYSIYYLIKFVIHFIISFLKIIKDFIVFPFKSLKNFLKSLFVVILVTYVLVSLFVNLDYLRSHYGYYGKFLCSIGTKEVIQSKVLRIVGGYSEGSGFFIAPNKVITNFHVIADEPTPKIIFPDGSFITPVKILGDKDADLAVLETKENFADFVLELPSEISAFDDEPLIAVGYALGTDLSGKATVVKGDFIDFRASNRYKVGYTQANINIIEGMSGGPLTDQCGKVVGINTMSLGGQSLFINANDAKNIIPSFTDQDIKKISVDPSASPEDAVTAFYTYLKARNMREGFTLLSKEYLKKTNFEEWTNRFNDILDVGIIKSEIVENEKDIVSVKFITKNWVL